MTCHHPSCRRRVMRQGGACYLHRPPNPRRNQGNRKQADKNYLQRVKRRRDCAGLAPGWEAT